MHIVSSTRIVLALALASANPVAGATPSVSDPTLALADDWLKRQRMSSVHSWSVEEAEELRSELELAFREAFFEELAEHLTFERHETGEGAGTHLRTAVTDFDVKGAQPKSRARSAHFTSVSLTATLTSELVDVSTGDVLHRFTDRLREGHSPDGSLRRSSRSTDRQATQRLAKRWAKRLASEVRAVLGEPSE